MLFACSHIAHNNTGWCALILLNAWGEREKKKKRSSARSTEIKRKKKGKKKIESDCVT